jgi:hypothetical protein
MKCTSFKRSPDLQGHHIFVPKVTIQNPPESQLFIPVTIPTIECLSRYGVLEPSVDLIETCEINLTPGILTYDSQHKTLRTHPFFLTRTTREDQRLEDGSITPIVNFLLTSLFPFSLFPKGNLLIGCLIGRAVRNNGNSLLDRDEAEMICLVQAKVTIQNPPESQLFIPVTIPFFPFS